MELNTNTAAACDPGGSITPTNTATAASTTTPAVTPPYYLEYIWEASLQYSNGTNCVSNQKIGVPYVSPTYPPDTTSTTPTDTTWLYPETKLQHLNGTDCVFSAEIGVTYSPETIPPDTNNTTSTIRFPCGHCCHKGCPHCTEFRTTRIRRNLMGEILTHLSASHYHITLTTTASTAPLRQQVTTLYANFSTLRRRRLWASTVIGSAYFVEVTYNRIAEVWHPHLHIFAELNKPIANAALTAEWVHIGGGSDNDIRPIDHDYASILNRASYFADPAYSTILNDPELFGTYREAMFGKREFGVTGAWFGKLRLLNKPQ